MTLPSGTILMNGDGEEIVDTDEDQDGITLISDGESDCDCCDNIDPCAEGCWSRLIFNGRYTLDNSAITIVGDYFTANQGMIATSIYAFACPGGACDANDTLTDYDPQLYTVGGPFNRLERSARFWHAFIGDVTDPYGTTSKLETVSNRHPCPPVDERNNTSSSYWAYSDPQPGFGGYPNDESQLSRVVAVYPVTGFGVSLPTAGVQITDINGKLDFDPSGAYPGPPHFPVFDGTFKHNSGSNDDWFNDQMPWGGTNSSSGTVSILTASGQYVDRFPRAYFVENGSCGTWTTVVSLSGGTPHNERWSVQSSEIFGDAFVASFTTILGGLWRITVAPI